MYGDPLSSLARSSTMVTSQQIHLVAIKYAARSTSQKTFHPRVSIPSCRDRFTRLGEQWAIRWGRHQVGLACAPLGLLHVFTRHCTLYRTVRYLNAEASSDPPSENATESAALCMSFNLSQLLVLGWGSYWILAHSCWDLARNLAY